MIRHFLWIAALGIVTVFSADASAVPPEVTLVSSSTWGISQQSQIAAVYGAMTITIHTFDGATLVPTPNAFNFLFPADSSDGLAEFTISPDPGSLNTHLAADQDYTVDFVYATDITTGLGYSAPDESLTLTTINFQTDQGPVTETANFQAGIDSPGETASVPEPVGLGLLTLSPLLGIRRR